MERLRALVRRFVDLTRFGRETPAVREQPRAVPMVRPAVQDTFEAATPRAAPSGFGFVDAFETVRRVPVELSGGVKPVVVTVPDAPKPAGIVANGFEASLDDLLGEDLSTEPGPDDVQSLIPPAVVSDGPSLDGHVELASDAPSAAAPVAELTMASTADARGEAVSNDVPSSTAVPAELATASTADDAPSLTAAPAELATASTADARSVAVSNDAPSAIAAPAELATAPTDDARSVSAATSAVSADLVTASTSDDARSESVASGALIAARAELATADELRITSAASDAPSATAAPSELAASTADDARSVSVASGVLIAAPAVLATASAVGAAPNVSAAIPSSIASDVPSADDARTGSLASPTPTPEPAPVPPPSDLLELAEELLGGPRTERPAEVNAPVAERDPLG